MSLYPRGRLHVRSCPDARTSRPEDVLVAKGMPKRYSASLSVMWECLAVQTETRKRHVSFVICSNKCSSFSVMCIRNLILGRDEITHTDFLRASLFREIFMVFLLSSLELLESFTPRLSPSCSEIKLIFCGVSYTDYSVRYHVCAAIKKSSLKI